MPLSSPIGQAGTQSAPTTPTPHVNARSSMSFGTRNGVIDLPIVGTKGSPKKFKGRAEDVLPFIQHYTRLCAKHGVTDVKEKLENITHYCSRHVREFLEGLDSYRKGDWDTFLKDFKEYYNADRDERRFRVRDLERFVAHCRARSSSMKTLDQWRKYDRGFIRIGGWLLEKGKITPDEHATYFWKGIPHKFRDRLENRLMGQYPSHDLAKPFTIERIERVAKALLQRNRFDKERMPSEDEIETDSDIFTDSDSDSDSDNSDDDDKDKKSSKKKSKKKKTKKSIRTSSKDSSDEEDSDDDIPSLRKSKNLKKVRFRSKTPKAEDGVEEMIEQLNKMSIDDPAYGTLYYRACLANPIVREIVPSPINGRKRSSSASRSGQDFEREAPPHFRNSRPPPSSANSGCYGCGGTGHAMYMCPKMKDLMDQGIVKRDEAGRYVMHDGTRIWRKGPDESIASAALKQAPGQAHLADMLHQGEMDYETFNEMYPVSAPTTHYIYAPQVETDDDEDSFNEAYPCLPAEDEHVMEEVMESSDSDAYTYAADRPVRSTRTARKEQFSGVWPPERRTEAKKADKDKAEKKAVPTPFKENVTPRPVAKKPSAPKPVPRFMDQQPIETRKPNFDANDSDIMMDDEMAADDLIPKSKLRPKFVKPGQGRSLEPAPKPSTMHNPKKVETDKEGPDRRQPRSSDLQAKTDTKSIIKKILHTPVTLPVGDILGTSKELAHQLQEILKPRSTPKNVALQVENDDLDENNFLGTMPGVYAASIIPKARGTLIKLVLEIDDVPVRAIIDTGSQLNIASQRTWQRFRARPKDITKNIKMNDANGGQGTLTVLCLTYLYAVGKFLHMQAFSLEKRLHLICCSDDLGKEGISSV